MWWPHHTNIIPSHLTFFNVVTLTLSSYLLECGHANSVTVPSWMWWLHHANTASSYLLECGHANSVILPFWMGWPHHLTFLNVVTLTLSPYLLESGDPITLTVSLYLFQHVAAVATIISCFLRWPCKDDFSVIFRRWAIVDTEFTLTPPPHPSPAKNPELPRAVSRMCRSFACSWVFCFCFKAWLQCLTECRTPRFLLGLCTISATLANCD